LPSPASQDTAAVELEICLLGPLELRRQGERVALPRSKKTRALLAYLVAGERAHSRASLCSLLWETTDDPRGALRWSLSKLRPLINDEVERLAADRESVSFVRQATTIDAVELAVAVSQGVESVATEELERLAGLVRGELLEGLELADQYEFQSWCVAARERAREGQCAILEELVRRSADEPRRALPWARARVRADPFGVASRRELLDLLLRSGKRDEAARQFEIAERLFRELEAPGTAELRTAWRALSGATPEPAAVRSDLPEEPATEARARLEESPWVGRAREVERLQELLAHSRARSCQSVAWITGEPGVGKSRLVEWLVAAGREAGLEILRGRAFEAESTRPFGPWTDALGVDVAQLVGEPDGAGLPATREGFFRAVAEATAARVSSAAGALLVLDDLQWLDRDSAELLHFVARVTRQQPLAIVLVARSGEVEDNEAVLRALRSLRREVDVESLELLPLAAEEIRSLVEPFPGADADLIHEASAGNPLYALELARAAERGGDGTPATLTQLVRDRVDRLPPSAAEVLRWGAVLGHSFDVARLETLSSLGLGGLGEALDRLEQHALVRCGASAERYFFVHDLVREAVYSELSQPRRRLMHRQIARHLADAASDAAVATEVAHHAGLAGDAMLGVRACIDAGKEAVRLFANAEAEALARRGLDLVDDLEESERIASTLELLHLRYSARTPDRDRAAAQVQELAERALDLGLTRPARLGFQMLSFLRWESSSMAAAHANILQAERVSRLAEPGERASALAHAARCFVLLERNMEQAEAFLLEAETLTRRGGPATSSVPFAKAMLHEHRGELDEAAASFREARWLGRERGDHLAEFQAIEHWTMLEIDRQRLDQASTLAAELATLGGRVRQGAEGPCAEALVALVRRSQGIEEARPQLEEAVADLRVADAKYELTFVLTRLAKWELERGDIEAAAEHAAQGLDSANAIGRASDIALAHTLLARSLEARGAAAEVGEHLEALRELRRGDLAAGARAAIEALLPGVGESPT
jgi:DNA-binding SARP family transcriptional activator